jgi:putative Mg2+ transporter-C (MgtC) family protein
MDFILGFGGPNAHSWVQVGDLFAALVLCGLIGLERELNGKPSGLRTNSVIGVAAALFTLVSKFGFGDVLGTSVKLDPSRIASLVVTGIGFIGAGLIFVHRGDVKGLTTAAIAWMVAAVGMACGANLVVLAAVLTAIYFVIMLGFGRFERHPVHRELHVRVRDGSRVADNLVQRCESAGFAVETLAWDQVAPDEAEISLTVEGRPPVRVLLSAVQDLPGLVSVHIDSDVRSDEDARTD